ncbi:MAG: hypothetical protein RMJ17_03135, partial [Candidatus Aenigmarchaeota archaeon]|nr:hypothetical protein [Candidatus Aenigmarchaeota archaeon]MDW8149561.1 hypothetical protein [Candidatus Aenigmarchaeota archaeon]
MSWKRVVIPSIISMIIIMLLFYLQKTPIHYFEECNELKRNFCVYNNILIYSNLDALIWIKNNIPPNSIVIAWQDYENELKNISNVKIVPQLALDLSLDNVTKFLCGARRLNASYLYLTGAELLYGWYMTGKPIIQPFELIKINETDYISTDRHIFLKLENKIWVPYTYYHEESGVLKLSKNISKMRKIIYYE